MYIGESRFESSHTPRFSKETLNPKLSNFASFTIPFTEKSQSIN